MMLSLLFEDRVWAEQLGYGVVGDLEVAHTFSQTGGGLNSLKFSLALPRDFYDPVIRAGAKVTVFRGSVPLGSATLSEPDRTNWTFTADGFYRKAETTSAEDALGNATSEIVDAIEAANDRRLGWNGSGDITSEHLVYQRVEDQGANPTIAALLNAECKLTGRYWGLDNYDVPYMIDAPEGPEWAIAPGVPLMPSTDATSVGRVTIKYLTDGTAQAPISWGYYTIGDDDEDAEGREVFIDISELGSGAPIPGQAEDWALDYFEKMKTRVSYTQALDMFRGELTNTGSVPIDFWAAPLEVLGKVGLHHGSLDKRRGHDAKTIQWTCGTTVFRDGPDGGSLTLKAIDFAPRVLPDVIASMNDFYGQIEGHALIDIFGRPVGAP